MRSDDVGRPRAVLVTGVPGSGKTTLATRLARELRVPFLARDDMRGGLLMTSGGWTDEVRRIPSGDEAVEAFLDVVELLLRSGVSCVLEYVVRSHRPGDLDRLSALADVVVIQVECDDPVRRIRERNERDPLVARPAVLAALGYTSVAEHTEAVVARSVDVADAMRTQFDVPSLRVQATDTYRPTLDEVIEFVTRPPSAGERDVTTGGAAR